MRVLFTCQPALPHLYPMIPLAWAFRAAGHEVRIASGATIADAIVRTGLPAVVLTGTPQWTDEERKRTVDTIYTQSAWPRDWALHLDGLDQGQRDYLEFLGRNMVRSAEAVAEELHTFARWWRPDLVVYDALSFAGEVVAAQLAVPAVRHMFGTATVPRLELRVGGEALPEYARLFSARGLPVRLTPDVAVDPTPPSLRVTESPPRLNMRYVPFNGAGAVPDWLRRPAGRPRVCVTWGHTSARALGGAASTPFRVAMDTFAELGAELVLVSTAEQLEQLGSLPAGARTAPSLPLHLVLPYTDVLVQQGGDGTTLTAAAYGVPQLAISRKPDAEIAPSRIEAVGAGIHLRYQELRDAPAARDVLGAAATALLTDNTYALAAKRLRAEIERQPAPAELVPVLIRLAEKWKGAGDVRTTARELV